MESLAMLACPCSDELSHIETICVTEECVASQPLGQGQRLDNPKGSRTRSSDNCPCPIFLFVCYTCFAAFDGCTVRFRLLQSSAVERTSVASRLYVQVARLSAD